VCVYFKHRKRVHINVLQSVPGVCYWFVFTLEYIYLLSSNQLTMKCTFHY